jgi:glucose/arabinose dehydrogenase
MLRFFINSMLWLVLSFSLVLFFTGCKERRQNEATTISNEPLFSKYNLDKIKLPEGFKINVFAEVPNARSMCLSDKGTLYVGTMGEGKVYAVVDNDHNGIADKVYTIASGLNTPNGVAYKDGSLYVAEINRILRFDNIETNLSNPPSYSVVYDKLPKDGAHGWKFIAFGPDNKLYVPIGAPCNICEPDSPYASITRMNPDGTGFELFARGIRNSVGITWHPQTKQLWFTDNGRDNMGDNVPEDELNVAPQKGMHFGYPFCHQGTVLDPEFGRGKNCSDYTPPVQTMGPHVAALGLRFYTGSQFPAEYRNQLFIANHGSWNRTVPIGYRVMLLKLDANNKPSEYIPFATGWLQDNGNVVGRPVDVQVAPDGALLVSDDKSGAIYRISYSK